MYRASRIADLCIHLTTSLREAMTVIDRNALGIALIVDGDRHLLATLTDGDVRRALLSGAQLDQPVEQMLGPGFRKLPSPITATVRIEPRTALNMMRAHGIRHLPLLDENQRVADLIVLDDLISEVDPSVTAVIMAGGYGRRLRPLTEKTPKPMLPVGNRPLLEHVVGQLREAGIRRILLTTHYRPDVIVEHFGNGERFGVQLEYVVEDRPLGTAGSLAFAQSDEPLLVMNGDILTNINFRAMLNFHREHGADLTVAVRIHEYQVPYGVVAMEEARVRALTEKPTYRFFINAGIYLLQPDLRRYIPGNAPYDMTDLIEQALLDGRKVVGFPVHEYWVDIGQLRDYERAQMDFVEGRIR